MLTVDQIMALKPCPDYPRSRVEALWAGREAEEEAERRYPNREWVESPRLAAAEAEVARLRGALQAARDLLYAVRSAHTGSIGGIGTHYLPQISKAWLAPIEQQIDAALSGTATAQPAPLVSSGTVRTTDPPAAPLPTCGACGSNMIVGIPAPPAAPDELRKAAERHYSTLLSGLAYVVRGSWWPEHDELTNGVREHVAKMRDAADELRAIAARGGE